MGEEETPPFHPHIRKLSNSSSVIEIRVQGLGVSKSADPLEGRCLVYNHSYKPSPSQTTGDKDMYIQITRI